MSPDPTTPEDTPTPTTEPTLIWGPTEAELARALGDAEALSDEAAAGQVIVARYPGTDPAAAAALVADLDLGGVIAFGENVADADQVAQTAQAVQDAVAQTRDWPAVVSVDNEGGRVQRLSGPGLPWTVYPAFQAAGAASGDPGVVSAAYEAMAREIRASGMTTDFAPDADVTIGPADVTIGDRSAGDDPERVSAAVVAALEGFAAGGVLTSIKHFPGHGTLNVDSHEGLPVLDTPVAELVARDLVPFAAGIQAGAPMVMIGHIAVTEWDPGVPASLSPAAYSYLREEMGFTGIAITDGLDMGALTAERTTGQIAAQALIAGADALLTPADAAAARDGVLAALADGSLSRERLTEAAGRVIAMVRWQQQLAEAAGSVAAEHLGSAAPAVAALAAAAVTVVAGDCAGPLVGERVHVLGGTPQTWDAFVASAAAGGLQVVPLEQEADTQVRLVEDGVAPEPADVVVSLGQPFVLAAVDAPVKIAAYGTTQGSLDAVVAVLTGTASAPGRLPVAVGGLPRSACG